MVDPRETQRPGRTGKPGGLTSDLAGRIRRARETEEGQASAQGNAARDMTGLSRGLRLGSEFIAAILVGAGIGYLLDLWLKTGPWLLLVFLLVGFAAGVLNVTRAAAEMNRASPPPPGSDLGPGNEEDDA
ncbi:MAG: F0F1 ATP synthase assembly protein I [Hyphomicrobiales bacterium]|nr:MAG: F0F1 ATP synthase assembly protein I [Hyphomicrobiales bacterium]